MIVKHNISAMNNERCISGVTKREEKRSEKLSSGYRINRAADDAAGLSISEKMRKQIRGLTQASSNAQDGISLLQTAEGALHEVHDMLHRMNQLAVQSANGTNNIEDRTYLQEEVTKIIAEVDRVAVTTKFNEVTLLDGSCANQNSIATMGGGTVKPKITVFDTVIHPAVTTDKVIHPSDRAAAGRDKLKEVLKTEIVPQAVSAIVNRFSNTFGYLNGSDIGIGLLLYEGSLLNNTDARKNALAYVGLSTVADLNVSPPVYELSYTLGVNLEKTNFANMTTGELTAAGRSSLESTIAHEMMHAMMDEALTAGMLSIDQNGYRQEGFPLWFVEGMAQAAGGGGDWVRNSFRVTGNSSEADIRTALNKYSLTRADSTYAHYATGYLATMYLGYLINGSNSTAPADIAAGLDILLNDIRGGKSLDRAIADNTNNRYAGIDDFEAKFAADGVAFSKQLLTDIDNGLGALVANSYRDEDVLNDTPLPDTVFNLDTGNIAVLNRYPPDYVVISGGLATLNGVAGPDYHNVNQGAGGNTGPTTPTGPATPTGPNNPGGGTSGGIAGGGADGTVYQGGLSLQVGSEAGHQMTIFIEAMNSNELSIEQVDISSQEGATDAIEAIGEAIRRVSSQRSALGAYQNRLEHTVKNLDNVVENTQAAESRIRDTDMAKTMVELSNLRIIKQAGQSMLVQTKGRNEGVLALLA